MRAWPRWIFKPRPTRLAVEVKERDGIELQLRVGLNSGQVIAGDIGSGAFGYTAVGEQVGMAQRMESVAPPGGVMLSESTARLVENSAVLGEPQLVRIKGRDSLVAVRQLLGTMSERGLAGRDRSRLVGRGWEMAAVEGVLDRAMSGCGGVVAVVGAPGIGKTRMAREAAALANAVGWRCFPRFVSPMPARSRFMWCRVCCGRPPGSAGCTTGRRGRRSGPGGPTPIPSDLLLFDDLLGIADPGVGLPVIDPDARRRRLTALVNAAALARETPALYVVEDLHWIDEVSESMLADFFTVIPQIASMVLITHRPEYEGALARVHGAQTIALAPLSDSETGASGR